MDDAISLLKQLGFGEYEAKAYAGLLQRSPLNGYELARVSGIPRPNIYAVLTKLEERGAVLRVDTPEGTRYTAVPPAELTDRLKARLESTIVAVQTSLTAVAAPPEPDYVWNMKGYSVLLEEAGALIDGARERLLVALWPQEAEALNGHIERAQARGLDVTVLCMRACAVQCDWCRGSVHRFDVVPEPHRRWLVLVVDSQELITGEIGAPDSTAAVRTRQRLLVDLANWYVRHTIALATILNDLGRRPDPALSPSTRGVLESVISTEPGGGWLEQVRQLLQRPPAEPE
ncbi:MAG: TrmB family transcriptional regulator [Chloroflexota bacterium]